MLLPLRVFPEGVVLKEERQGFALPLILRDDRPAVSLPGVKEDLRVATRLHPERLDRLVHPFPHMVIANVQSDLKKANDDGKLLTKEKSLEKAIHEIDAMFGWGIEGTYVQQFEKQGTYVQPFKASEGENQTNYTTVDYNPGVVACQDKAYKEYFGESKLDETTRREVLDDHKSTGRISKKLH
jgi:hypothetical protein